MPEEAGPLRHGIIVSAGNGDAAGQHSRGLAGHSRTGQISGRGHAAEILQLPLTDSREPL